MPTTYIYVFKRFKVSKKTRKTSEVCKKPVLQNKTGGCFVRFLLLILNVQRQICSDIRWLIVTECEGSGNTIKMRLIWFLRFHIRRDDRKYLGIIFQSSF